MDKTHFDLGLHECFDVITAQKKFSEVEVKVEPQPIELSEDCRRLVITGATEEFWAQKESITRDRLERAVARRQ